MSETRKRVFIGVERTGGSATNVKLKAKDEAEATKLLKAQYGRENIIEVRADDGRNNSDQTSKAESDVGRAVTLNLLKYGLLSLNGCCGGRIKSNPPRVHNG
jgi:hypothetical protein